MAATAAPGTAQVRDRAVEAKRLCDHARGLLRGAAAHLSLLMRVADARGGRAQAENAGVELFNATRGLAYAAEAMVAAAGLLAQRGAAADPTAPLSPVAEIPDADEPDRSPSPSAPTAASTPPRLRWRHSYSSSPHAAADPTAPRPSVADIPDAQRSERSALDLLREAKVYAEGAYDTVGCCCNRLLTAHELLDRPSLPGVDWFVDYERGAAHRYLIVAENLAGVSAAYTYTALCLLFPD
ncbi:unnamed protein product [Urochloa decumbens]|uniref:Uncharacterized protein n=1 Tax=Urochloa decumbens TaxID=240449 RepID=A0ABC8ZR03_9POAL